MHNTPFYPVAEKHRKTANFSVALNQNGDEQKKTETKKKTSEPVHERSAMDKLLHLIKATISGAQTLCTPKE